MILVPTLPELLAGWPRLAAANPALAGRRLEVLRESSHV